MSNKNNQVCPVELSAGLDNKIRRWFQNPQKILGPYIKEGMTVLDLGCGPGFFSLDIAQMVGDAGQVIAADVQEGMLQKVKVKIKDTELEDRITLHKCDKGRIAVSEQVDFILLFYLVHEVPSVSDLFNEIVAILKPKGQALIVEPPLHVSKSAFEKTVQKAIDNGLSVLERPNLFLNKAVLLRKG